MRALLLSLLLVLTPLAGCLNGGGPEEPGGPGESDGTYQLAWIHGTERLSPPPESYGVCDVRFDHGVDAPNRTLVYLADAYAFEPANITRMIAWDVWEAPSWCPLVYTLDPDASEATRQVGAYGDLTVSFEPNGTLNVDGTRWLDPGENTTITYSERVEEEGRERWRNASVHIEHYERWPTARLSTE